jgi:hypothetical protein
MALCKICEQFTDRTMCGCAARFDRFIQVFGLEEGVHFTRDDQGRLCELLMPEAEDAALRWWQACERAEASVRLLGAEGNPFSDDTTLGMMVWMEMAMEYDTLPAPFDRPPDQRLLQDDESQPPDDEDED